MTDIKFEHMNLFPATWLFVAAGLLTGGCASSQHRGLVLDPIGPPPSGSAAAGSQGTLVVFSAADPTPGFDESPYRRRYSDYRIVSADGKELIQTVHNDTGKLLEGPRKVELAAGEYRVLARANGYGLVEAPVVIKPGQVTTVHLEGSTWWPQSSPIFASNPVRLPHGQIVGWRAEQTAAK